jgi:hypothetical protein
VTHQGSLSIARAETSAAERLYRCVICGLTSRWHNPFDSLPPKNDSDGSASGVGMALRFLRFQMTVNTCGHSHHVR